MADVIGTTASIVALLGTTFSLLQQVRDARNHITGSSKTLDEISRQLQGLEMSLSLVKEEGGLQTAGVEQQVRVIKEGAGELKSFFDRLAAEQRRKAILQFFHALKSGDKDDDELRGILNRLDRARAELALRISVAQVGLVWNLQDGFRVAYGVLTETNRKVNEVLGINLVLADRLEDRSSEQTADGMITVDVSDTESLGLGEDPGVATRDPISGRGETLIIDNITLGQARIMTGNVGVENWYKMAGRKATVEGNIFRRDVSIMTGDLGGHAARNFNENFWK